MTHPVSTLALVTSLFLSASGPASAADSAAITTQGASIRLIADASDRSGLVRGVVLFELEPGWKTYWREPGEVGLAPSLSFEPLGHAGDMELFFPAPRHLDEGGTPFNGYDSDMGIAFEIRGIRTDRLELSLFAGLCRDLCIPVSGRLTLDLSQPLAFADRTSIEGAFLALPDDGREALRGTLGNDELLVDRAVDVASGDTALFVSGPKGWRLGVARNEGTGWRVPILDRPKGTNEVPPSFDAVLSNDGVGHALSIEINGHDPATGSHSSSAKRDDR